MKKLKIILLVVGIIVAIPLVVALFVPKNYHVEEEVVINQPEELVFDYIKLLKNQNNYSKWATMDPDMDKTYTGVDGRVGFISAWDSDNEDVGKGEQEITKIVEGERVEFELRFFEPFESKSQAFMTTETVSENETKVVWGFDGHMNYPMNLMLLFMDFEEMIGDDLSTGLGNLKKELE